MCTTSSVYPVKNYKLKIVRPDRLRNLNESFTKKYMGSKQRRAFTRKENQNGSSL